MSENHDHSCVFKTVKWFLLIYMGLVFIMELFLLIFFFVDFENASKGIKNQDRSKAKGFVAAGIVLSMLITLIQIAAVYKEHLCGVITMAAFMLASIVILSIGQASSKSSYSGSSIGSSVIWFLLCAGYALLIVQERKREDQVVPYVNEP